MHEPPPERPLPAPALPPQVRAAIVEILATALVRKLRDELSRQDQPPPEHDR